MYLSKNKRVKYLAIIPTLLIFSFTYLVFNAFYPNEGFYIEEWERNITLPFPKSACFEWKDATYPDQHNDYTSTAIIEVSENDFDNLYKLASENTSIQNDSIGLNYKGLIKQYLPEKFKDENLIRVYFSSLTNPSFKLAFGKDNKTLIFQLHNI